MTVQQGSDYPINSKEHQEQQHATHLVLHKQQPHQEPQTS